jgi:threonyl-tRNA synthetase
MENLELLAELVKLLEKEKIALDGELASLQKKQTELARQQKEITNKVRDKEREMVTQEKIDKYKAFWQSLGGNDSPPCPLCFMFHGTQSDLQPLPERNSMEHLRCKNCGQYFHLSLR